MSVTPSSTALASDIINGTAIYAADAGASDSYAITLPTSPGSYVTGAHFIFKANTANTGAATLNINSLGAKTIKKSYNLDLQNGDIKAGQLVEVSYDGTNFQMISPVTIPTMKTGVTTHDSTTTGTQTIAHGLGATPRLVKIRAKLDNALGGTSDIRGIGASDGSYDGTSTVSLFSFFGSIAGGSGNSVSASVGTSTTYIIVLYYNNTGPVVSQATVAVDDTNITLTWSKSGSPSETAYLIWEAFA